MDGIVNRISVIVVSIFIATSLHAEVSLEKGDTLRLNSTGVPSEAIQVTAALKSNRQVNGIGNSSWGIGWMDNEKKDYSFTLRWGNTDFGDLTDERYMLIELTRSDSVLFSEIIMEGVDLHTGSNTINIQIDGDGYMHWKIGDYSIAKTGELVLPSLRDPAIPFYVFTKGSKLNIHRCKVTEIATSPSSLITPYSDESFFVAAPNQENSPVGIWMFLDRDINPKWARLGGRYALGIREAENNGAWDIIYLDGAETNADRWQPGMLKGTLKKTPFVRHYNLEWVDSTFERMDEADECSATLSDDGNILTLNFPLDHSILRFYRKTP